jgi:ornithine carrier protein
MQVPIIKSATVHRPLGAFGIVASVYRHQGLLGFWHGQLGTLIRETGGSAAWFGSYEGIKKLFHANRRTKSNSPSDEELAVWQRLLAGAIAGMSYNFIFYPADTIKSRMQTEDVSLAAKGGPRSFFSVGRAMWAQHGLKGFYRGCGITVARAAPSSAFIFSIYEALKGYFG